MASDPLDDLLDRSLPEPVPTGFAERVLMHVRSLGGAPAAAGVRGRVLRPVFGTASWVSIAAAALVFLGVGYWLGRGAPDVRDLERSGGGAAMAEADITGIYQNLDVLRDLDLAMDADLELALADAEAATTSLRDLAADGTRVPDPDPEDER
ncbi:MAG TPA: hypothetical protein VGC54_01805 [Planctomycetota bacterium]